MKKYLILILFVVSSAVKAQVGIGTIDPKSSLDIVANTTVSEEDGLLIPRVAAFSATNPGVDQNSMLVYLTTDLTNVNISGTPQDYDSGFYYWDNSIPNWVSIGAGDISDAWELEGNAGTDGGTTNFMGTTDDQPISFRTNNIERVKFGTKGNIETFQPGNSVAVGRAAGLLDDGSDNRNTFLGDFSGESIVGANTAIQDSGFAVEGAGNVGVGYQTLQNITSGWNNTAVGYRSQASTTGVPSSNITFNGVNNTSLGWKTLENNLSGNVNVAIGNGAMSGVNYGDHNLAIGSFALSNATNSVENIAIGAEALNRAANSTANVSIGFESSYEGPMNRSVVIGHRAAFRAGDGETTNADNVAIGFEALFFNKGGANNVAVGAKASKQIFGNFSNNISVGANALEKQRGEDNIAIGSAAGSHDIAFGAPGRSDFANNTIFIGKDAGRRSTVNNSILIGTSAGIDTQQTVKDNILIIEQSERTGTGVETTTDSPLVYGEFDTNIFRVGGQLQVGRSDGTAGSIYGFPTVDGTNGQVLTTDGSGNVTWQNGASASTPDNLYTADGTLGADRTVNFGTSDLTFNNRNREFNLSNGNSGTSNTKNQLLFAFGGGAFNRFRHAINTQHDSGSSNRNRMLFMLHDSATDTDTGLPSFESLRLSPTQTIFNDGGDAVDFIAKSDTHADAFELNGATGAVQLGAYGAGTITGTATRLLAVDANGNVIERDLSSAASSIVDNDGDTMVQVEESPDEDLIRFDLAGTEHFVMTQKGQLEVTGINSILIGNNAGNALQNGMRGVYIGEEAGSKLGYAPNTVAIGYHAMKDAVGQLNPSSVSASYNTVAIGFKALMNSGANSADNVAIGSLALTENTGGARNVAIGKEALKQNSTGNTNVGIGPSASLLNTTGGFNIALGYNALKNNRSSSNNIAIGSQAMEGLATTPMTGDNNVSIGVLSSISLTSGIDNTALGNFALNGAREGDGNTGLGKSALYSNKNGDFNTVVGDGAGFYELGSQNTYIGRGAGGGYSTSDTPAGLGERTLSGNIAIGYEAGRQNETNSNKLYIANSNTQQPLIAGDFTQARVGINTNTTGDLTHTLTVGGDVKATDYEATNGGFATGYADYVFEDYFGKEATINEDYKFMPLTEAVNFVKENGHLPNVMSYEEFKADNFTLNLATTSLKNLEKIEENFLYIAELEEKNKTLEEKVKKLELQQAEILKLLKEKK